MSDAVRPTKKQRELLDFIENFINQHGYSPSYREIMNGLQYNSVATVALHVGNLIKRGHLKKRDHSARSLEVVTRPASTAAGQKDEDSHESWLVSRVENCLRQLTDQARQSEQSVADEGQLLLNALRLLGLQRQADSLQGEFSQLQPVTVDDHNPDGV